MRSLKRVPVYQKNGKTNIRHLYQKIGVYAIFENGKIVYIGHSRSNLYRTILRHFQSWEDKKQRRVSYQDRLNRNDYTVKVYLTQASDAPVLEEQLIEELQPRDNELKLLHLYEDRKRKRVEARRKEMRSTTQASATDGKQPRFHYNKKGQIINPYTKTKQPDDIPF